MLQEGLRQTIDDEVGISDIELDCYLNFVSAQAGVAVSESVSLFAAQAACGLQEAGGAVVVAQGASVAEDGVFDSVHHGDELVVVAVGALVAGDGVEAGLAFGSAGLARGRVGS